MRTSFYFVLWIIIYPLLGLLHNQWVTTNAFFVALIVIWALSWFLNRSMPETLIYERILSNANILNEVYTGNVQGFKRRLYRTSTIEFISALYFGVAFLITILFWLKGGFDDWLALIIFGFLAAGTLVKASRIQKLAHRVSLNPNPQECVDIVDQMGMNYGAYYEQRQRSGGDAVLPPPPRGFNGFQIFSILIAAVCAVLGVIFIVLSVIGLIKIPTLQGVPVSIMYLLYGSLATYYGVKDFITSINYFRLKKQRS